MEKLICYTLDLEPDFGGRVNTYHSLENLDYFKTLIRKNRIKLTTFATANLFSKKKNVIKQLIDLGSEIELHSYSHNPFNQNEEFEIKKSKKAYRDYFRKNPFQKRD